MRTARPIRFGTGAAPNTDPAKLARQARRAEEVGYSTFGFPDHFMNRFGPIVGAREITAATTTLHVSQFVLDHDFRHPAVLAKELATIDLLSGGRVEVGLGAGWMRSEYDQAGIAYDPASVRIERLEEYAQVLRGLFADGPLHFTGRHYTIRGLDGQPKPARRPGPPLLIGGGGPKLLAVAGRQADIVHLVPRIQHGNGSADLREYTAEAFRAKIAAVGAAAGARLAGIEFAAQLLTVSITDDADSALAALKQRLSAGSDRLGVPFPMTDAELLASPLVAIGPLSEVCEKLLATRDELGVSYFVAPVGEHPLNLAPVIERVAGT